MSRIGRKPVAVPDAVTVTLAPGNIAVKGPKGELTQTYSQDMTVSQEEARSWSPGRPIAASTAPSTGSPAR